MRYEIIHCRVYYVTQIGKFLVEFPKENSARIFFFIWKFSTMIIKDFINKWSEYAICKEIHSLLSFMIFCFSLSRYDNGLCLFMLNPMVFWKFSTTIIKDLYTNKVECAKQKYKQINKRTQKFAWCACVCKSFTKAWNYIHIFCSA